VKLGRMSFLKSPQSNHSPGQLGKSAAITTVKEKAKINESHSKTNGRHVKIQNFKSVPLVFDSTPINEPSGGCESDQRFVARFFENIENVPKVAAKLVEVKGHKSQAANDESKNS